MVEEKSFEGLSRMSWPKAVPTIIGVKEVKAAATLPR
jgi:hypothetical protein